MEGSESGVDILKILAITIPVLVAFSVAYYVYWLNNRTPIIGIRQNISQVIDPKMPILPEIVFKNNEQEFRYKNLFIVDAHIYNRSKKTFTTFDLTVTTRIAADIVFVSCNGQTKSHEAILKSFVDFETPSKVINIELNPFNIHNRYLLTLYVTSPDNQILTNHHVKYSSKVNSSFKPEN